MAVRLTDQYTILNLEVLLSSPEGCTNSVPSCCRLIVFVQQPAKSISPTHPCINGKRRPRELFLLRCLKLPRAVRPLAVVMMNVDPEDVLEVAPGADEQPVIQGELSKLGIKVSATAIRKLLGRSGLGPAPRRGGTTWPQFLAQQASSMVACDFFVETVWRPDLIGASLRFSQPGVVDRSPQL
jgi:hypothetical protein